MQMGCMAYRVYQYNIGKVLLFEEKSERIYCRCCLYMLFLTFTVLVAYPREMLSTLTRSWSAEQRKEKKKSWSGSAPPPPPYATRKEKMK